MRAGASDVGRALRVTALWLLLTGCGVTDAPGAPVAIATAVGAAALALDEPAEARAIEVLASQGAVDEASSRAALLLARGRDPVAAAAAARVLASRSCDGARLALSALDTRASSAGLMPRSSTLPAAELEGLVQEVLAAAACDRGELVSRTEHARGAASSLARSQLVPERALAILDPAPAHPAVLARRAQVLLAQGQAEAAAVELELALVRDDSAALRARLARLHSAAGRFEAALAVLDGAAAADGADAADAAELRLARVMALAGAGRDAEVARAIAAAPVAERLALARAAAGATSAPESLGRVDQAPLELVVAAGRQAMTRGRAAEAAALLEEATRRSPEDADSWIALAEALAAAGDVPGAVAAWDRAAERAPALEVAKLAPIGLLVAVDQRDQARARARELARRARSSADPDELALASAAARRAGDTASALALAREAVAARPDDGALRFALAERLEQAGHHQEATSVLATLLICGMHGRPWHRHEVTTRLAALLARPEAPAPEALTEQACEPVEPVLLATYLDAIEAALRVRRQDRANAAANARF